MQAELTTKSMPHEAWAAIRKVWLGADCVKEANVKRLRREFDEITFNSAESVEDFLLHLNTVASQLCVLGEEVTDKEVIKRLLHSVPQRLEQVAISMETLLDLDSLSIEEAVGASACRQAVQETITEEEWLACMKSREGSDSHIGAQRGGATSNGGNKSKGVKQETQG
jgi:hypothetical protein